MKATNIIWDTDERNINLPSEIEIPESIIEKGEDDFISDYLSDETGFCHKGYVLEEDDDTKQLSSEEIEVLNYLASMSKMDCWFFIIFDGCRILDIENDTVMSIKEGVLELNEGITALDDYNLSSDEKEIYENLLKRLS